MSARGRDFFPQLDLAMNAPQHAEHFCEAPGCDLPGSWGFRAPGFEGLRQPCHWFCFTHKAEGDRFRRSSLSSQTGRAA
jgi:hypothetical protein